MLGLQLFALGLLGELIIFTHAREMKDHHGRPRTRVPQAQERDESEPVGLSVVPTSRTERQEIGSGVSSRCPRIATAPGPACVSLGRATCRRVAPEFGHHGIGGMEVQQTLLARALGTAWLRRLDGGG